MRSISRCHVVSLLYLSYLICRLPLIQLTMILFWTVLIPVFFVCSMALKWFSSYLSHQFQAIKIGQPSQNCMSCFLECHKALFLALCSSLYTSLLWVKLFKGIPISIYILMPMTLSCLFICPTNMPPQHLINWILVFRMFRKWMSTSRIKLNPEKIEFIIFGSHAQLKKLDSYLPVRIFDKLLHPSDSTWQMRLQSWRQMPWWAVIWTTATPFSEVFSVSTCANCSVSKSHLVDLSQIAIDTHGILLFSKNPLVASWISVYFKKCHFSL